MTNYCIDTSSIIDAGERNYPPDVFPGFWTNMDALIGADRLKAPEMLLDELKKKTDEWRQWVYDREASLIIRVDGLILATMPEVVDIYTKQRVKPDNLTGDPFFIATAKVHGLTLITSEKQRPGGARIPAICQALGVSTISLVGMLRQEGWKFGAI